MAEATIKPQRGQCLRVDDTTNVDDVVMKHVDENSDSQDVLLFAEESLETVGGRGTKVDDCESIDLLGVLLVVNVDEQRHDIVATQQHLKLEYLLCVLYLLENGNDWMVMERV
ncbi:hypothetical protein Tco_1067771 [Tanacetum coccineum]|uniref:Uncharacterized protein n=1 Tax=Tanacetum coccineum TaxID=301880 RepID=A0ABQ5HF54_9ASTR